MKSMEGWAFLCLMGCLLFVTLSLVVMEGVPAVVLGATGVILGILSGGLYAASGKQR